MEKPGSTYHPTTYWNKVAMQISQREGGNIIAGDDEPYYRYKRKKFLKLLHAIPFEGRSVLEVGCGPGGNLLEVYSHHPSRLAGLDLSEEMLVLARKNLAEKNVELHLLQGRTYPFRDRSFDIIFTSTVLQHTTDDQILRTAISEICRVSKSDIYIFERIEKKVKGNESCLGRTVDLYEGYFGNHGFRLVEKKFLYIQASYVLAGLTRKLLNRKQRREGEKLTGLSLAIQSALLPVSKLLDRIVRVDRDLAMLHFKIKQDD